MWRKLVQPAWIRHQETTLRFVWRWKKRRGKKRLPRKTCSGETTATVPSSVDTELNGQQLRELAEQEPRVIAP